MQVLGAALHVEAIHGFDCALHLADCVLPTELAAAAVSRAQQARPHPSIESFRPMVYAGPLPGLDGLEVLQVLGRAPKQ